jgi:hypothetical protein
VEPGLEKKKEEVFEPPPALEEEKPKDASVDENRPKPGEFLGWSILIVPDDYKGPLPHANWIYQRYKDEYEKLYNDIAAGSTSIKISENSGTTNGDAADVKYPGFQDKVLKSLKRLLTTKSGRTLLKSIAEGGFDVSIRPSTQGLATTRRDNDANAKNGTGSASTLYFDPHFSDKTVKVFDKNGKELATPFFLALGHELIHAAHNQDGINARDQAPSDAAWGNKEEENAIDGSTGVTENALRKELGLGRRFGHGGTVTGKRTKTIAGGKAGG